MTDYSLVSFGRQIKPEKETIELDLDEVIRSLEEAAREIENLDWEQHRSREKKSRTGEHRGKVRSTSAKTKKASLQS